MPIAPTYPGVYIEELPSGTRVITGVATSITAFLGRAARGPVNAATRVLSFADFERTFGGLDENSTMSYAVQNFFLNGGTDAYVVRLFRPYFKDFNQQADAQQAARAVTEAIAAPAVTTADGAKAAAQAVLEGSLANDPFKKDIITKVKAAIDTRAGQALTAADVVNSVKPQVAAGGANLSPA